MNRQQKENLVDVLKKDFAASAGVYVVGCKGVSVNALQTLRRALRGQGASLRVVKMRLAKRAIGDNATFDEVLPYLREQRGLIFAFKEPIAIAKVLSDYVRDNAQLELVVARVEHEMLDVQAIQQLAHLPSRDVLIAQLLGTMQSPVARTVGLFQMMLIRLLVVLKQIAEKREPEA